MTNTSLIPSILFVSILGVTAVIPAGPAQAQAGDQFQSMLARADANGDGAVTWAEFMALRTGMVAAMDRNDDGYVDSQDRPRLMASRFDEGFERLVQADANRDGRISRAELTNRQAPAFEAADTDRNRVLSASEIAAIRPSR